MFRLLDLPTELFDHVVEAFAARLVNNQVNQVSASGLT
jgi:hypothetical protein